MTKKTEATNSTEKLTIKEIGISQEKADGIKVWFNDTRRAECSNALNKWLDIGDVCSRIKAGKFKGTLPELTAEVLGIELSRDEIQYSMLLHGSRDAVIRWAKERPSYKYNPRTLWTAYQAHVNPKPEKVKGGKGEKTEKEEKELRKERKAIDALEALVEYRRIRSKAGEDGNLLLKDLEMLKAELENELKEICEAIALEAPVMEKKAKDKKAKALKDIGTAVKKAA